MKKIVDIFRGRSNKGVASSETHKPETSPPRPLGERDGVRGKTRNSKLKTAFLFSAFIVVLLPDISVALDNSSLNGTYVYHAKESDVWETNDNDGVFKGDWTFNGDGMSTLSDTEYGVFKNDTTDVVIYTVDTSEIEPVFYNYSVSGDGRVTLSGMTYFDAGEGWETEDEAGFFRVIPSGTNGLVGSWLIGTPGSGEEVVLTFLDDINYMMAHEGTAGGGGQRGMERGTYTWNSSTGAFTATTINDTNGEWGLSHPDGAVTVAVVGNSMTYFPANEGEAAFTRVMPSGTNSLVGSWFLGTPGSGGEEVVVSFLDDTNYIMAHDGTADIYGQRGMERGTYSWNSSTGAFTETVINDTNGEWGFSDPLGDVTVDVWSEELGILSPDGGIIAAVDSEDQTDNGIFEDYVQLTMEVLVKKGSGMNNASLTGTYVYHNKESSLSNDGNNDTEYVFEGDWTFDGDGNCTTSETAYLVNKNGTTDVVSYTVDTSESTPTACTYSVASDGLVTIDGAQTFMLSPDGNVMAGVDSEDMIGAEGWAEVNMSVLVKKGSGMNNASLTGTYVYHNQEIHVGETDYTEYVFDGDWTFDGDGNCTTSETAYLVNKIGSTLSYSVDTSESTATACTFSVASDGLVTIDGAQTFMLSPDGNVMAGVDSEDMIGAEGWAAVNMSVLVKKSDTGGTNTAPDITSDGGLATASVNAAENQTAVTTVTATDGDSDPLTFSITGGADSAKFSIGSSSGELTFNSAPDFETPTDSNTDGVYVVDVTASDGTDTDVQTISVTVTESVNSAPVITSDGGLATASISKTENVTAVTAVTATDANSDPITFSITGGTDSDKFSIGSSSGVLTFIIAPDFENPTDSDTDNVYVVDVVADDGTDTDVQTISVTVTDISPAPSATIDLITPSPANEGEAIHLTGSGSGGTIDGYEWKVDLLVGGTPQGSPQVISNAADFYYNSLTASEYRVYFRTRSDIGEWSAEETQDITVNYPTMADLLVQAEDIRFLDAAGQEISFVEPGGSVDIEVTVRNPSLYNTEAGKTITVKVYDGTEGDAILIDSDLISSIEAGASANIKVTWVTEVTDDGCLPITAVAQYTENIAVPGSVAEVSTQNNSNTDTFAVGGSSACDGGITVAAEAATSPLNAGSKVTIQGTAFYPFGGSIGDIATLGAEVTVAIDGGGSATTYTLSPDGTYSAVVSLPPVEGTYDATITVSDGAQSGSITLNLNVGPALEAKPDFVNKGKYSTTMVTFSGDDVYQGSKAVVDSPVVIKARIWNLGTADATGGYEVAFYDGPVSGGNLLGTASVADDLAVGDYQWVEIPAAWTPAATGVHNIVIKVDPANSIAELDEVNNEFSRSIDIRVRKPDLKVNSGAYNPYYYDGNLWSYGSLTMAQVPALGDTVDLSADIYNVGTDEVTDITSFEVKFFDGHPDTGTFISATTISGPVPRDGSITATVPWDTTTYGAGYHTIYVDVDTTSAVDEDFETNNRAYNIFDVFVAGSSDVWPVEISLSSYHLINKSLSINAYVKNRGDTVDTGKTVTFHLGDPDSGGSLIGSLGSGSLASAESKLLSQPWTTPATPQWELLCVKADGKKYCDTFYFVDSTAPDPGVLSSDITVSPTPACVGQDVSISAVIKNYGEDSASNLTVRFYAGAAGEDQIGSGVSIPFMSAGVSQTINAMGSYVMEESLLVKVVVTAPSGQDISGSNNLATKRIDAPCAGTDIDLTVSAINIPGSADAGVSFDVSDTVDNLGFVAPPSYLYYYLSSDNVYDSGDTYLGTRSVGYIDVGGSDSATTSVTIPTRVGPGNYYIIARADARSNVAESDEDNNTLASASTINIGSSSIDLTVTSVTVPGATETGVSFNVSDTVENLGVARSTPSYVKFYLSVDQTYDPGDTYLGIRGVGYINAGGSDSASTSVKIPTSVGPGNYYVIARADARSHIIESNEGNNNKASATTISVTNGIDLTVSSVTVNAPLSVQTGQNASISYTVNNLGAGRSTPSYLYLYLSLDNVYDSGDRRLVRRSVGYIDGGGSSSATTSVKIRSVVPGDYYIIAVADGKGHVIETNEGNNERASASTLNVTNP